MNRNNLQNRQGWAIEELNLGPHAYQTRFTKIVQCISVAISLWYPPHAIFEAPSRRGSNSPSGRTQNVHSKVLGHQFDALIFALVLHGKAVYAGACSRLTHHLIRRAAGIPLRATLFLAAPGAWA